jgi:hypothetical protein
MATGYGLAGTGRSHFKSRKREDLSHLHSVETDPVGGPSSGGKPRQQTPRAEGDIHCRVLTTKPHSRCQASVCTSSPLQHYYEYPVAVDPQESGNNCLLLPASALYPRTHDSSRPQLAEPDRDANRVLSTSHIRRIGQTELRETAITLVPPPHYRLPSPAVPTENWKHPYPL